MSDTENKIFSLYLKILKGEDVGGYGELTAVIWVVSFIELAIKDVTNNAYPYLLNRELYSELLSFIENVKSELQQKLDDELNRQNELMNQINDDGRDPF